MQRSLTAQRALIFHYRHLSTCSTMGTLRSLHYASGPCVRVPQPKNRVWTKAPLLGWPKATRAVACHASQDQELGQQQQLVQEPELYSRAWYQRNKRQPWRRPTFWGLFIPFYYVLLRWLVRAVHSWLAGGA